MYQQEGQTQVGLAEEVLVMKHLAGETGAQD